MPFIALNKETGARVDITREPPEIIRRFTPGALVCQLCSGPMFPRSAHERKDTLGQAYRVQAHFVHVADVCDDAWAHHPESREHRIGKVHIATEWLQQFGRYRGAVVDYEVPIKEIKRIADVLAELPNGHKIAHEVQLAKITPRELEDRTNDYARAGIDVYWHLGKDACTEPNREFLASALEDYSIISFSSQPRAPGASYTRGVLSQR